MGACRSDVRTGGRALPLGARGDVAFVQARGAVTGYVHIVLSTSALFMTLLSCRASTVAGAMAALLLAAPLAAQRPTAAAAANTPRQTTAAPAAITALHQLDFLIGEWEGTGWIRLGPGEPHRFQQHETVRQAAGGAVVVIDGLGRSTAIGEENRIVHTAFAVISYDSTTQHFRWRAYRGDGAELDVVPSIGVDRLVWGFPSNGSQVRFTIERTPTGQWHETGELVRDGAPAVQFFEMTLQKR